MVIRLNEEEMNRYIKNMRIDESMCWVVLNISNIRIQEWIENGTFAFIKKELQIYHNMKFGCLKNDLGCQYYFFVSDENAMYRLTKFFDLLWDGKRTPIHTLSTKIEDYRHTGHGSPKGSYNACPLF